MNSRLPAFEPPQECLVCHQPVGTTDGCRADRTIKFATGDIVDPLPYGHEARYAAFEHQPVDPCSGCGVMPSSDGQPRYHHASCPHEVCPRCGETYQSCGCTTDEKLRLPDQQAQQGRGGPGRER